MALRQPGASCRGPGNEAGKARPSPAFAIERDAMTAKASLMIKDVDPSGKYS